MLEENLKITVSIVTFNRTEKLLFSLDKILNCNPKPDEILIHIDGDDKFTYDSLSNSKFKDSIKIITSKTRIGPGGGRNKITAIALNPLIAQFDDDSYPIDKDYFERIKKIFITLQNISIIDTSIYLIDQNVKPDQFKFYITNNFTGCGCVYLKEDFLQTEGYIQLPTAYGMEEIDIALRLHSKKKRILKTEYLRVLHNTKLEHHNSPEIVSHLISNIALRVYLRYPVILYPYGMLQIFNMIYWLISQKKFKGILKGIYQIPVQILQYSSLRKILHYKDIISFKKLNNKLKEIELNGFN